jgi:hypothetical protein
LQIDSSSTAASALRVLGEQGADGVDLGVDLGDAVQVGLDDFAGGDLVGRDQRRQGGGILTVQRTESWLAAELLVKVVVICVS